MLAVRWKKLRVVRIESIGTVIMVHKKPLQRSLFLEFREPWQRGLAIALGLTLGLLPKFSFLFASLLIVALFCPVSLVLCFGVTLVVSLISPQIAGLERFVGEWLLGQSRLQVIWETLYSFQIFRAIGFQNSQVMGSLVLALGSFYPTFLATTTYFQRRRKLDLENTWPSDTQMVSGQESLVSAPQVMASAKNAMTSGVAMSQSWGVFRNLAETKLIDTVLSEDGERREEGLLAEKRRMVGESAEIAMTTRLITLPEITDSQKTDSQIAETHTTSTAKVAREAFKTELDNRTGALDLSTEDSEEMVAPCDVNDLTTEEMAEAERALYELVAAKQLELQSQSLKADSAETHLAYQEQQWVLDTLIEIIRLKDEALRDQSSTDSQTDESIALTSRNLLAPLANAGEANQFKSESYQDLSSDHKPQATEDSMEKIIRTDASLPSGSVKALGNSESGERISSSAPGGVNVAPHLARPRSMYSRDESLKFLIHHLQCLQREREE